VVFKIHWTLNKVDDYAVVEGDSIKEIQEKAKVIETRRGLNPIDNNMWSEEIK